MDVVANRSKHRTALEQQALVATLKQMPVFAPQPVEPIGKSRLQPLHACDEVALGGLDGQVVVIRHDDERVQPPPAAFARLKEAGPKRGSRRSRLENPATVVPAIDDVIQGPGELELLLARHPASHSPAARLHHLPHDQFQVRVTPLLIDSR